MTGATSDTSRVRQSSSLPGLGVSGPVVADFGAISNGASPVCRVIGDEVIKSLRKEPESYYVEVHTTEFSAGALRGQLTR